MVAILVLTTVVFFVAVDLILQHRKQALGLASAGGGQVGVVAAPTGLAEEPRLIVAEGHFLAPGHTAVRLLPDGALALSSGPLPAHLLGAVDRIELPLPGRVQRGDTLAVLHGAGRSLHLSAPVDGVIEAVNRELAAYPGQQAVARAANNWLVRLRPHDLQQALAGLHFAADAQRWLQGEVQRLRDLLASVQGGVGEATALADGGLPRRGLARELEPERWAKLEQSFFAIQDDSADRAH
ncbi:MAG: hypothetical protein ABIJ09_13700 [Pseudomonadota bacterium]